MVLGCFKGSKLQEINFWTLAKPVKPDFPGSGSKSGKSWDFFDFLDFRDPDFPNSFRKNRSPMAPQGKPLCGKGSHMDPLHVRFSSETVESICFYQSDSTFSWKPCFLRSSVWGQFKQVFVFPPRPAWTQKTCRNSPHTDERRKQGSHEKITCDL